MRNIALILEYDGGVFHGWQSQVNAAAIQDVVEDAIRRLDGAPARITGASRTDAGVHARGQVANFHTASNIPADKYAYALNAILPGGVACVRSFEAPPDFNARFAAKSKIYSYLLMNRRHPSPLFCNRSWHIPLPLDVGEMRNAAELFIGEHDFRAFMSSGSPVNSTVRTITRLELATCPIGVFTHENINRYIQKDIYVNIRDTHEIDDRKDANENHGAFIRLVVEGNGFLYNMIRIMAGTLVYVGQHRLGIDDVSHAIASGDRKAAGKTAPPQGLCLECVKYE
jgi:tRNA pseudouridine38-40 synthase